METLQERVAFLEGRAAEHSQVMDGVHQDIVDLRTDLKDGLAFVQQQFAALGQQFAASRRWAPFWRSILADDLGVSL